MIDDVRQLLEREGHALDRDSFDVPLFGGRKQTVKLAERNGSVRLWSVVASSGAAARTHEGALQLLRQNRFTELVEFTMDGRGRWIAQVVLPAGAVSSAELREYVRALATAADRIEQVTSGKDAY